jgi:hypothetical protein
VVKPVQDRVRHNSACSVEAMPVALQVHGKIQGWIRKAWPQRRVRSASIVMREPRPPDRSKPLAALSNLAIVGGRIRHRA